MNSSKTVFWSRASAPYAAIPSTSATVHQFGLVRTSSRAARKSTVTEMAIDSVSSTPSH